MIKYWIVFIINVCTISSIYSQNNHSLENKYLSRKITTKDFLRTTEIVNKQTGMRLVPVACDEFILRFSEGTDKVGTDFILRSEDFKVEKTKEYKLDRKQPGKGLQVTLSNEPNDLVLNVYYELPDDKPYLHKYLSVTSKKEITLERIDVDVLSLEDVHQPYTKKAITSQAPGNWSPGLGQPVYTLTSGIYWGMEFPASTNTVTEQQMAEGIKWVDSYFPAFGHVKMYGGDPRQKNVYGYSGWSEERGYISMHNPSDKPQKLMITMDRSIGIGKQVKNYKLSSPLKRGMVGLKETWSHGDTLTVELQPKEVRILTFDTNK